MKFRKAIVIGLVIGSSPGVAWAAFPKAAEGMIPKLLHRYDVPIVSVSMVQGSGVVWSRQFSETRSDYVFEVASLSKTATALAVLSLVDEKRVSLDEPVNTYLHRWRVRSKRFDVSKVTVRRLLDHTAGLPVGTRILRPLTSYPGIEEVLDGKTGQPVATPVIDPGTKFQYSNPGYGVLELMVEEVTQTSFPEAMRKLVFDRLGMHETGYQDDLELESRVVAGYRRAGHPVGPFLRAPRASGGMLSTPHDIGILLTAAMLPKDLGGLLSKRTLEEMHTLERTGRGAFGLGKDGGYALGIATGKLSSGDTFVANNGSHAGYNALILGVPSKEIGLVVLTNSDTGFGVELELAMKWLDETAHDRLGIATTVSRIRTALRLVTYLALFVLLFYGDRLIRQVRRGQRSWSEDFRVWDIARGIALISFGIAFGVVFDSSALTRELGGLPPARFISGEYQWVVAFISLLCIATGGAVALVGKAKRS